MWIIVGHRRSLIFSLGAANAFSHHRLADNRLDQRRHRPPTDAGARSDGLPCNRSIRHRRVVRRRADRSRHVGRSRRLLPSRFLDLHRRGYHSALALENDPKGISASKVSLNCDLCTTPEAISFLGDSIFCFQSPIFLFGIWVPQTEYISYYLCAKLSLQCISTAMSPVWHRLVTPDIRKSYRFDFNFPSGTAYALLLLLNRAEGWPESDLFASIGCGGKHSYWLK